MNTLKEHIKSNKFSPVYLLYGEEDYLMKMYKDNLKMGIIGDDLTMNYSYYEGKNIDVTQVIDTAKTLPFFSDKRLIIIENSNFFETQNPLSDDLSSFPDSTYIIFVQDKTDKRTKLYKQIKKLGTVSEFKELSERNLGIWVASQLKKDNKKITQNDVNYLLEKTGPSMVNLQNELEKLICFCLDKDVITKEDIDAVCIEQTEGKIFQMIDAITNKEKDIALNYYYDLLELKESPMSIMFLLSRHFKILIQIKDLNKLGFNNSDIGKKAGVNPYFVGKYITQARKVPMNTLKHNLYLCNETDGDIKRGNQTDQLGVEILIIQFAS